MRDNTTPRRQQRLTDAQVGQIRSMYYVERRPVSEICAELDLPQSTVYAAATGWTYKNVPMPADVDLRRTKIPQATVDAIRADNAAGYSQADNARRNGVSAPYVRSVISGAIRTGIKASAKVDASDDDESVGTDAAVSLSSAS